MKNKKKKIETEYISLKFMFSNDQIFYHEPIFHQGFTNVQYKESHQQLSFLK